MTGEITLRGLVMPVGGIKEKVLAAHRAGIKKIILPRRNQIDLEELPEEVLKSTKFVFADTVDDVLKSALLKAKVSRIKTKIDERKRLNMVEKSRPCIFLIEDDETMINLLVILLNLENFITVKLEQEETDSDHLANIGYKTRLDFDGYFPQ